MKVIKEGYEYEVGAGQAIRFMGDGCTDGAADHCANRTADIAT